MGTKAPNAMISTLGSSLIPNHTIITGKMASGNRVEDLHDPVEQVLAARQQAADHTRDDADAQAEGKPDGGPAHRDRQVRAQHSLMP